MPGGWLAGVAAPGSPAAPGAAGDPVPALEDIQTGRVAPRPLPRPCSSGGDCAIPAVGAAGRTCATGSAGVLGLLPPPPLSAAELPSPLLTERRCWARMASSFACADARVTSALSSAGRPASATGCCAPSPLWRLPMLAAEVGRGGTAAGLRCGGSNPRGSAAGAGPECGLPLVVPAGDAPVAAPVAAGGLMKPGVSDDSGTLLSCSLTNLRPLPC